jgi:hypothetical protein
MGGSMDKKIKKIIFLSLICIPVFFWLGFRSGEIYNRMQKEVKNTQLLRPPALKVFYIVEETEENGHTRVRFDQTNEQQLIMKFFYNKKLKPLLKLRNLKIYTPDGERIY